MPGATSGFLSAAKDAGAQWRAGLNVERAGCHRTANFVGRDGHSIDAQLGDIERNVQIALDSIGVEHCAHGMSGRGKLADGCTTPVSLLATIMLTSDTSSLSKSLSVAGSM